MQEIEDDPPMTPTEAMQKVFLDNVDRARPPIVTPRAPRRELPCPSTGDYDKRAKTKRETEPQFLGESSKRLEILNAPFSNSKLPSVCVSSSKLLCELRYGLVALLFFAFLS